MNCCRITRYSQLYIESDVFMKRLISKKQEQAYRLCHHEFGGYTTQEAAEIMGVSVRTVERLLKSMEAKVPQLFPILTEIQWLIYQMYVNKGLTEQEIANFLSSTQSTISEMLNKLKKKGMFIPEQSGLRDMVNYEKGMDSHIITKF